MSIEQKVRPLTEVEATSVLGFLSKEINPQSIAWALRYYLILLPIKEPTAVSEEKNLGRHPVIWFGENGYMYSMFDLEDLGEGKRVYH